MEGAKQSFDRMADFVNANSFAGSVDAAGNPIKTSGYQHFVVFTGLMIFLVTQYNEMMEFKTLNQVCVCRTHLAQLSE